IAAINAKVHELLIDGDEAQVWNTLSAKNVFETQPTRLETWLAATNSKRVVFGHTPHGGKRPAVFHNGPAINFDGGLCVSHPKFRGSPVTASVAPLEAVS